MVDDDELTALRARVAELEARRARDQARIAAILANIPAVLYVKDDEGRYEYGSRYCFELLGIAPEDAIGRTAKECLPSALAERFTASDERLKHVDAVVEESYAVPLPSGPRHFLGVRFPIRGAAGESLGLCGFAVDVTERVELQRELARLATIDPLTRVANRRAFDQFLGAELARIARTGEPLSLILCDADHFKRLNDRHGHLRGDACLYIVAEVLSDLARRPADLVARYGGEEFVVVLAGTGSDGARQVAERMREAVRARAILHDDNDGRGVVTISVGVATISGGSWTPAEVVALADEAMYAAKAQGRDRVVAVEDDRPPASASRLGG